MYIYGHGLCLLPYPDVDVAFNISHHRPWDMATCGQLTHSPQPTATASGQWRPCISHPDRLFFFFLKMAWLSVSARARVQQPATAQPRRDGGVCVCV
jgi:hypothetical protein